MSQTSSIPSFNRALQDAETWLRELSALSPFETREAAYALFRAVLHSIRDRLEMHEAVHFAGQMPTLIRGIYYEGWRPSLAPNDERSLGEFLASVRESLGPGLPADAVNVEEATRSVFTFLETKFDEGQIRHVREQLPSDVQALWPSGTRARAPKGRRTKQTV